VILPDVNVLIHAFRTDSTEHKVCKSWLDQVVLADAQFGISPLVLSAVVRITTNSRVFVQPSTLEEAFGFCTALLSQPHCECVEPGERHWGIFARMTQATGTRGPKVSEAWFAALALERGCTWVTLDRDYARFPGLDWRPPA
jgi:toxin-antitoxin system PIN domain toxin